MDPRGLLGQQVLSLRQHCPIQIFHSLYTASTFTMSLTVLCVVLSLFVSGDIPCLITLTEVSRMG